MNEQILIAKRERKSFYREGDALVKVFDEAYAPADVLNEALNQARVMSTCLNIPKIRAVNTVDGKWAITMDYIEGRTLQSLIEENPDRIDEYLAILVDVQLEILSQRVPLLTKLRDKMTRKIAESGLDATTRYELNMRLEGFKRHNKLCHGDLNPSNIILTPDGKRFVIDWAHATQGNGSADVARTYLMIALRNEELAERYLDLYCRRTDTAKQYVRKWFPIVAASQSVKGKPEEREFLLRWTDVVDFE